jgi:hypothetical protein
MHEQHTVEIEGEAKPACVAEAIMRAYFQVLPSSPPGMDARRDMAIVARRSRTPAGSRRTDP